MSQQGSPRETNTEIRQRGMPWAREMTQLLAEQRQAGITDFPIAWTRAVKLCTHTAPQGKNGRRPADDPDCLPFGEFYRQACEREWNGQVHHDYAGLRELADMVTV